ncbi:MAG: hypothetical protein ISR72_07325 [Methylobacter sp.]|nr:hypothetical protein [Methylobacter sp.]
MNDPLNNISSTVQYEITKLIYSGEKISAIKRYREFVNCDLKTAKEAIESITEKLKTDTPHAFKEQPKGCGGCLVVIVLLIAGGIAIAKIPDDLKNEWLRKLTALLQTTTDKVSEVSVTVNKPTVKPTVIKASVPIQLFENKTPYQPIAPDNIEEIDLTSLYRQKLANADYIEWKNTPGLPRGYQDFIEEHHIKYVRAKIAEHLFLPTGTKTLAIPVIPTATITIDGAIQHQEWRQAIRIPLEPKETGSILYLQADNDWLYLAADVPGDTTRSGFDQFRFYIHVDIDPAIVNERIHVNPYKPETLGGIRQTRVSWQGDPPKNKDENWKKYPISDWRIYRLAKGASTLEQHRQFEAKLNLKESGLTIGSPLPVFVEIETDPVVEGKSRKRMYLGGLGNQNRPVWMIMK